MFENSSKNDLFFGFLQKKNQCFSIICFFFVFSSFRYSKQKSQLAEYDIVGMFAENLVEGGFVWWVESGFFLLSSYMEYIESIGFTQKILKNCFCSNHVF
jgi:hypothetical protein